MVSVLSTPCQCEMVMPLLCTKERPEPLAIPEGKESHPLISPVQVLSLSITPFFLLPVGLSISSNSFLPIDNPPFTNSQLPLTRFCHLLIKKYCIQSQHRRCYASICHLIFAYPLIYPEVALRWETLLVVQVGTAKCTVPHCTAVLI